MSNTNKSAARSRILPGSTSLLLAAVVALEVTGMQALSHANGRAMPVAAANGETVYMPAGRAASSDTEVVAQAAY
jgi:hypothetical protein